VMGALATVSIVRINTVNAGMTRIGGRPKLEDLGKTNRRPKARCSKTSRFSRSFLKFDSVAGS
jgi:hypothetical protein